MNPLFYYKVLEAYDNFVFSCWNGDGFQDEKFSIYNAYLSILNFTEHQFHLEILKIVDANWVERWN